ncbi:MAG: hypothetical protein ACLPWF_08985 [Bryobacteraceae bacterium]
MKRPKFTRRHGMKAAMSAFSVGFLRAGEAPDLTGSIPLASPDPLTGSQFAESVLNTDRHERERAILDQLVAGNLPSFLRKLVPVELNSEIASGKALNATIFVMPEYLAIGSDGDFLRIPMNLHTATAVASRFGFVLPTRKIVDAIYDQSTCHFTPQPLPAGPQMTSTEYYRTHNAMIDKQSQSLGFPLGALVSGHKKDVVLTNRLVTHPGQIAIYGWHRAKGEPIQPLSTVHGAGYADYSHGIRLVAKMAIIDGRLRSVSEILHDSKLARVLSDEGPIRLSPTFGER